VTAVIDETPGAVSLRLRPGEATGFLPGHPYGRFTWDGRDAGPVLLVGAGSGTVPLMSMIRHAAQRGGGDPVVLVCSAITYSHAFYRAELARLASRHPWLRVVHCSAL
jgi:ferredoxin-NADP reductase